MKSEFSDALEPAIVDGCWIFTSRETDDSFHYLQLS